MAQQMDQDITFQQWLEDPENCVLADQFIAQFVADYGVEFMFDLLIARKHELQSTSEQLLEKLSRHFDHWQAQGMPVSRSPRVKVVFTTGPMEVAAERYLLENLPKGTAYMITSRHGQLNDALPFQDWKVQIGESVGTGTTPFSAARAALASWQQSAGKPEKPEPLNAPSARPQAADVQARKQA